MSNDIGLDRVEEVAAKARAAYMHHRRQRMFRPRDGADPHEAAQQRQAVVEQFLQQVVAQALVIIQGSPPNSPPGSPPRLRPAAGD